jgi:hypothetical protein
MEHAAVCLTLVKTNVGVEASRMIGHFIYSIRYAPARLNTPTKGRCCYNNAINKANPQSISLDAKALVSVRRINHLSTDLRSSFQSLSDLPKTY